MIIEKKDLSIIKTLMIPAGVSVLILLGRVVVTDSGRYLFLVWNLLLGMVPLMVFFVLRNRLKISRWSTWPNLLLTFIFLAFLPNAFYIITDYTHLRGATEINVNYDILLITAFAVTGLMWGYCATLEFHDQLRRRFPKVQSLTIMSLVFLASSFAIYLGRFVRWNSWDIVFQPAAIIFDVSEQVLNPVMHSNAYFYTLAMFMALFSVHYTLWQLVHKNK